MKEHVSIEPTRYNHKIILEIGVAVYLIKTEIEAFVKSEFDIIFKGKKGGVLTDSTTQEDVDAYKFMFQSWSELITYTSYSVLLYYIIICYRDNVGPFT